MASAESNLTITIKQMENCKHADLLADQEKQRQPQQQPQQQQDEYPQGRYGDERYCGCDNFECSDCFSHSCKVKC